MSTLKCLHSLLTLATIFSITPILQAAPDDSPIKEAESRKCAPAFEFSGTHEASTTLIARAKRDIAEQLFGSMISSTTQIANGKLTKDAILSSSLGYIRIKGSPSPVQGAGIGEICVIVTGYVTEEDRAKLKPRTVESSKKICIADPDLPLGKVQNRAERTARLKAVRDSDPRFIGVDDDIVIRLLHNVEILSSDFLEDAAAYCVRVRGTLKPLELDAALKQVNGDQASQDVTLSAKDLFKRACRFLGLEGNWPLQAAEVVLEIEKQDGSPSKRKQYLFTKEAVREITIKNGKETTFLVGGGEGILAQDEQRRRLSTPVAVALERHMRSFPLALALYNQSELNVRWIGSDSVFGQACEIVDIDSPGIRIDWCIGHNGELLSTRFQGIASGTTSRVEAGEIVTQIREYHQLDGARMPSLMEVSVNGKLDSIERTTEIRLNPRLQTMGGRIQSLIQLLKKGDIRIRM